MRTTDYKLEYYLLLNMGSELICFGSGRTVFCCLFKPRHISILKSFVCILENNFLHKALVSNFWIGVTAGNYVGSGKIILILQL